MPVKPVIYGKKYANWTALEEAPLSKSGHVMVRCRCDCGVEKVITKSQLFRAETKHCWKCYKDTSPSAIYQSRKRLHEEKELDPKTVDVWKIGFK